LPFSVIQSIALFGEEFQVKALWAVFPPESYRPLPSTAWMGLRSALTLSVSVELAVAETPLIGVCALTADAMHSKAIVPAIPNRAHAINLARLALRFMIILPNFAFILPSRVQLHRRPRAAGA
jgi:hypothetical protein